MASVSAAFNPLNVKVVGAGIIKKLNGNFIIKDFLKQDTAFARDTNSRYGYRQTITIPKQVTVTSKTRTFGTAVDYETPSVGSVDLTLDKVTYNATSYDDFDAAILNEAFLDNYTTEQADSLARQMETDVMSLLINDADVPAGNEIGFPENTLDYEAIVEVNKRMLKAGVPKSQIKVIVVGPELFTDLILDEKVRTMSNYGDQSGVDIREDAILFRQLRLRVVNSLYLPAVSTSDSVSGSTGFLGVAMTDDCGVLATRSLSTNNEGVSQQIMNAYNWSLRMTKGYDMDRGVSKTIWEILWGFKVHRPELVFPIRGGQV